MHHAPFCRGQGTTEYIILLALVLAFGLAVLGIMGFFPMFSYNSQLADSAKYWADSASPIAIIDFKQQGTSFEAVLENRAPLDLNLTSFILNSGANYSAALLPALAPGAKSTLLVVAENCSGRKVVSYNVFINYSTEEIANLTQIGEKKLFVQCLD